MRRPLKTISCAMLLCPLALAGCGGGSSTTGTNSTPAIAFKSPALVGTSIPALYTCDGKNISPPLEWGAAPAGTGQFVVFILGVKPEPGTNTTAVYVVWAVAGVNPHLHGLSAGQLPPGAYLGAATNGKKHYSLCPEKGETEEYQFELYAIPAEDKISRSFIGEHILSVLTSGKRASPASAHGVFDATYKRP